MSTRHRYQVPGLGMRNVLLAYTLMAAVVSTHSSMMLQRLAHWANTLAEYSSPLSSWRIGDTVCVQVYKAVVHTQIMINK